MLILVAVTVKTVIDSGLFGHAKNAVTRWAEEEQKELSLDNHVDNLINQHVPNHNPSSPDPTPTVSPKIGDFVNYSPSEAGNYIGLTEAACGSTDNPTDGIPQDTRLKWQVMNINSDGTIDLVADRPISSTVYFGGALGYNNGVYLLDDLCRAQYSNSTLGVTSRSIDLVDIEKHFNATGEAARNAYIYNTSAQYGSTKTYSANYSYAPQVWNNNDKNVNKASNNFAQLESNPLSLSTETFSQLGNITVTQTGYNITSQASYYDDPNFHNLIFSTGTNFWLASRFASCHSTVADFGLRDVYGNHLSWLSLFNSYSSTISDSYAVRPVVTLPSTVKLEQVASSDNTWNIVSDIDDALDIVD